jgi:peptidoglycan hydrolase-like protein with peptidoglycan-binding domain
MTTIFSTIEGLLNGPVGNNLASDPRDVRIVKKHLNKLGLFDDDTENGYITAAMDEGIKRFQRDNGLREDGRLYPGGETERAFVAKIEKRKPEEIFGPAEDELDLGHVGFGGNVLGVLEAITGKRTPRVIMNAVEQKKPEAPQPVAEKKEDSKIPSNQKETDFYEHYKKGSGAPITYTSEEMRANPTFQGAMNTNRRRFEDSMATGEAIKNHPFQKSLKNLKNGETIILNSPTSPGGGDYWDRDIKRYEGLKQGDIKQSLETGSIKLRSTGNFKATRKDDKIYIEGIVDHSVKDVYNFNKSDREFSYFRKQSEKGEAKPFAIRGSNFEKFEGILEIKNGQIRKQDFKWTPIK